MGANPVQDLAVLYARVGRELSAGRSAEDVCQTIVEAAVETISGVDSASVTQLRGGQFRTIATTSDVSATGDLIQYEMNSGPCVDSIVEEAIFRIDDLETDGRWPAFAARGVNELGVRSMLSHRLLVEDEEVIAGLNMYSGRTGAFDDSSEIMCAVLATHAAVSLGTALARERAEQLHGALQSNREIGIAMGILMHQHKVTRDQAFDLLRIASQHTNRKLADVAADVADTGALELPRNARRQKASANGRSVARK